MTSPRQATYPVDNLFTQRWSPRAFTGEAIASEQLLTLLEAARWAPSAYNAQPWRFVYAHRDTVSWQPIFDTLIAFNQSWAAQAAALVVVTSARQAQFPGKTGLSPNPSHSFDTGAAWVSLAFQATLSGWAAHAIAGFDAERLRQAIGVPESHAIEAVIVIGKQGDKSLLSESLQQRETPNGRLELAQVVSEGRFGALT